ncbi:MAG: hydantoinase B/oxoprolinase family protein, partial [Planctomycetes bacterium]|nr:hydantoinase B/oxoprolinase family protein [Planctomycetota bacterium]
LRERASRSIAAVVREIPDGRYRFVDQLDGAGSPQIVVAIEVRGERMVLDFKGSSPTIASSLNAHESVTLSAVFYALRCLAPESIPTNSGLLDAIELRIPPDTIVGARSPAAVAGGNVETSQRIVDVVFGALAKALPLRMPAASQGSMNNLSLGGTRDDGSAFTYFETLAGGIGAGPEGPGASALHSHMTNTLNTPIEAFELDLPVRVTAYHQRRGSGGPGRHRGGEGIVREIEALRDMTLTLLTTRRAEGPWPLRGGVAGRPGRNVLVSETRRRRLAACLSRTLRAHERVRIETPGGGGWGRRTPRAR